MKPKAIQKYTETNPFQLELFFNRVGIDRKYTNTIGLYDVMPKYKEGNTKREKSTSGNFESLPILKYDFEYGDANHHLSVIPAKIEKDGKCIDFYPSYREKLVEEVLRKFVCEGMGKFYDNEVGVVFSLYSVREELAKRGHGYKTNEIKEALNICAGTILDFKTNNKTLSGKSAIFPKLIINERGNDDDICFVRFHPFVTKAILENNYKKIHFERYISLKKQLASWLYSRMAFLFHPNQNNYYHIMLSTIIKCGGMEEYTRISDSIRKVKDALDEMVTEGIIREYLAEVIKDPRNKKKFTDCKFHLYPSNNFINDSHEQRKHSEKLKSIFHTQNQ